MAAAHPKTVVRYHPRVVTGHDGEIGLIKTPETGVKGQDIFGPVGSHLYKLHHSPTLAQPQSRGPNPDRTVGSESSQH